MATSAAADAAPQPTASPRPALRTSAGAERAQLAADRARESAAAAALIVRRNADHVVASAAATGPRRGHRRRRRWRRGLGSNGAERANGGDGASQEAIAGLGFKFHQAAGTADPVDSGGAAPARAARGVPGSARVRKLGQAGQRVEGLPALAV